MIKLGKMRINNLFAGQAYYHFDGVTNAVFVARAGA